MSHNYIQIEIDYYSNFFKDKRIAEDLAILPWSFGSIYYWDSEIRGYADYEYYKMASVYIGGTEFYNQKRYFICG